MPLGLFGVLTINGGSASIKTVGESSQEARSLREFGSDIVAARFFKHGASKDPLLAADRTLTAFTASCAKHDGTVLPHDSNRSAASFERVAAHLLRPTGHKHQFRAKVAVCENSNEEALAGFLAVVQDNSEVARSGDAGSQLIGSLFGIKRMTRAREQAEALQQSLAVGDETNCSTVVAVRRPMAELLSPQIARLPTAQPHSG